MWRSTWRTAALALCLGAFGHAHAQQAQDVPWASDEARQPLSGVVVLEPPHVDERVLALLLAREHALRQQLAGTHALQQPMAGSFQLQQPMAGTHALQQPMAGSFQLQQPLRRR
jgi:hypothetical protein